MTTMTNRQWLLRRRPEGLPKPQDFELRTEGDPAEPLENGQIRIRNLLFLCAPTMRNWMDETGNSLYPSIPLGSPVMAPAAARVVASKDPRYPVGSRVTTISSWQDYETIDAQARTVQLVPAGMTAVEAMGVFGLNSLTAYFGLLRVGKPQPGETLVVSGAAGSTGSIAAQIGKIKGCRVIGIAGGSTKCQWLIDECGLDAAIDYRAEDVEARLRELCPDGIDVFFDNVGGEILQAAIENMARFGRIVLCGQIASYNNGEPAEGPRNMMRLIYGSIVMQGFLMGDYRAEVPSALAELEPWIRKGRIVARVDVRSGFEELPEIYTSLFTGANEGTLMALIDQDAYASR